MVPGDLVRFKNLGWEKHWMRGRLLEVRRDKAIIAPMGHRRQAPAVVPLSRVRLWKSKAAGH